ncbi:MAG: winged helix-turn-helix transcriptional regulator [Nitrososphaerales archaeon]
MGEKLRESILKLLSEKDRSFSELLKALSVHQQILSRTLKGLEREKLIRLFSIPGTHPPRHIYRLQPAIPLEVLTKGGMRFPKLKIQWTKIAGDLRFPIYLEESVYRKKRRKISNEVESISKKIAERIAEMRAKGNITIWNGERFRLYKFIEGRTEKEERVTLKLYFEDMMYSDFLAAKEFLDRTINWKGKRITRRKYYLEIFDPAREIIQEIPSDFGIGVIVITKDPYLVLTRRRETLAVSPGLLHVSIHEGMARGGPRPDFNEHGKPDPYATAIRSAKEELNIELRKDDVEWIVFGHDPITWEYNLFGVAQVKMSFDELLRNYMLSKDIRFEHGRSKENELKYELVPLSFDPDKPDVILKFLLKNKRYIYDFAKAGIIFALLNFGCEWSKVVTYFS